MAENTGFVTCFLKVLVDKSRLPQACWPISISCIAPWRRQIGKLKSHSGLWADRSDALNRFARPLRPILGILFRSDWRSTVQAHLAAQEYVAGCIRWAQADKPELLVGPSLQLA